MAADEVFRTTTLSARELAERDLPSLQALFEANPDYFVRLTGRPPRRDEVRQEFDELPPEHIPHGRRWILGLFQSSAVLAGVSIVVRDLGARGVWHIALFLLDSRLHGSGEAQAAHAAPQAWARSEGADWLRLGVVAGNARAERFWMSCGYREVRRRSNVPAGDKTNEVKVMVKPLGGGSLCEYLSMVPRDHPDSRLP